MRISNLSSAALARETSVARKAIAGSFSLSEGIGEAPRPGMTPLRSVGGMDALMALQGMEDAIERRQRAVRKGRNAIDALEELKVGLIAGQLDGSALNRLRALAADLSEPTGDNGLDGVMAEIDLRVQVEIAKLSLR